MSIVTTTSDFQEPPFPVRRFTVSQYHRMIQCGILGEEDQVELLEGWIVPKMPRNPPHDAAIDLSQETLRTALPATWRIRVQSAITTKNSEPEPDLAVVPGPALRYVERHPRPEEIALLAEVAESSLQHDRDIKGAIYAEAGIPRYWIINLVDRWVEENLEPKSVPGAAHYAVQNIRRPGERLTVVLDGVEYSVAVNDLLPGAPATPRN